MAHKPSSELPYNFLNDKIVYNYRSLNPLKLR
jgi:hypothetical protein